MDQLANDCPCKRQRVSEGDDIDQETGILLDGSAESRDCDDMRTADCFQGETTVGQEESLLTRAVTQSDPYHGSAGDSESNSDLLNNRIFSGFRKDPNFFSTHKDIGDESQSQASYEHFLEKEQNQSMKNIFTNQVTSAQSTENQSANTETGFQPSNLNSAGDAVSCLPDLNQTVRSAPKVQSRFCDYVQNVQAIAESSYIRTREKNTPQNKVEKLPKMESPKLKRHLDRVNTNLAKKRMERSPQSVAGTEELNKFKDDNVFSLVENSSTLQTICDQEKTASNSTSYDKTEIKLGEESDVYRDTLGDLETNVGNRLENSFEKSTRDKTNMAEVVDRVIDSKINTEIKSQTRIGSNTPLLTEGFDVSGFVEMFSNSVMGNIMRGSSKCFKKVLSNTGSTGRAEDCGISSHMTDMGKDGGNMEIKLRKPGRSNTSTGNIENCHELDTENVNDKTAETCKFEGDGNILGKTFQGAEDDKNLFEAANVETLFDPLSLGLGTSDSSPNTINSSLKVKTKVSSERSYNRLTDSKVLAGSAERRMNQSNEISSVEADASVSFIEETTEHVEGTEHLEAFDNDTDKVDMEMVEAICTKKSDANVKGEFTSAMINGRFKLDFKQTQDIINQCTINSLPITVLVHILKNLTVFELLCRASCVCKYWYNLCRDPDIWRSICLVNQHRLSDSDLKKVLCFSDYRVRNINLTDCRFLTNKGIKFLVMSCQQIEVLKVMRCFDLTDVAFEGLHSLSLCSSLKALYMDGCCRITDNTVLEVSEACPQLRILHLNQCTRISDISITGIARNCPYLTNLQLDHCSQVTDVTISEIVMGCPGMLYLNLMCCGITDIGVKYLAKLTKLTNLDLSNIPRLTSDSIVYLSKYCKNLQCINVSLNTVMDDRCISQLAMNLPLLKRLYCVSCSISDKGLEDIAKYRPTLEALDVGWCQDVTDHGVRVISLSCKHLDYFGLIRCDRVTLETIEELVLKYPRINYSTFILESRRLLERARNEGYQFSLP